MFLSRIQLNPQRRRTRWLLSSPQRVHAEVLNAFPEAPTGDRAGRPRVLWRVDMEGRKTLLYIVSPSEPDFSKLAEEAGWLTAPGEVKSYSRLLESISTRSRWSFRLTANPVRYESEAGAGRGKRRAHVTVHHQERWLIEKAPSCGFTVVDEEENQHFALSSRRTANFTRGSNPRPVTISTAQFDGQLVVTDPEALRQALVTGIGPAKAYGCGLLTLAPPRR